jgi:hypothetical protein
MVWREMRPQPLTDDKITAIYKGRDLVAEFKLPPTTLLCWHFDVKDDRDYWVIAIIHLGNVDTRMFRTIAEADAKMRQMISFITLAVLENQDIVMSQLERQLSMDNDDDEVAANNL